MVLFDRFKPTWLISSILIVAFQDDAKHRLHGYQDGEVELDCFGIECGPPPKFTIQCV